MLSQKASSVIDELCSSGWVNSGEHSRQSHLTHDTRHPHCLVPIQAFEANRNAKELETCFWCTEH